MPDEARLEETEAGLAVADEGWFLWPGQPNGLYHGDGRSRRRRLERLEPEGLPWG